MDIIRPPYFDGRVNPYSSEEGTERFRQSYPVVRSYRPGNPTSLFANARQTGKTPMVRKQPREWVTGVYTFDHAHLKFARSLTEDLSRIRPDIDDDGFSRNGLHSGFDSLRTVAGYPQEPVSALPRDNATMLEDLGIQQSMSPRQLRIAERVLRSIFSELNPKAVRIPKQSTSGPVRNVSDSEYKLQYGLHVFSMQRYNAYLDDFMKGDLDTMVRNWDACIFFGTNVRWQVDTPGKIREYWDARDVVHEASPHKRQITTKVVIDGIEYSDFAAMRTRMINQGPWTVNILLQVFATGFMQTMFKKYPMTWYRDEEELKTSLNGYHLWFGDVSQYDHSFSKEKIDLTHTIMKEYLDERVVTLSRQLYYAAYFTRPTGDPRDGHKPTVVGDPSDYLTDQVSAGNRSGHAFTSVMAKIWKVIDSLCKLDAIGVDVHGSFEELLKGQMHVGIINNGDDEIIWFKEKNLKDRFERYIDTIPQAEKMFHVEFETGGIFSGRVWQRLDETLYAPVDRIPATFEKMICPERSIGGVMRPAWPIGMIDRYNRRTEHDLKEEAFRMFDFHYRKILEPIYGPFLTLVSQAMKNLPISGDGWNWRDKQVLEDPSKIYYKFKPEDISEEVLELSFAKLQPEFFMDYVRDVYSGNIIYTER
nr:MAG: putative RNA-dependent RNA polymerase [Guangxi cystovirus 17]